MATISGKWMFKSLIIFSNYEIDVNFVSNSESFNRMTFVRTDKNLDYSYDVSYTELDADGRLIREETVYSGVDASGKWSAGMRIVDFGNDVQEVPDTFRELMESIATKMETTQDVNRGLKDGSSFICPMFDSIKVINDKLNEYIHFYVRLSDVPEEVIE